MNQQHPLFDFTDLRPSHFAEDLANSQRLDSDRYKTGYIACASEVSRFIFNTTSGFNLTMIANLVGHLHYSIEDLETQTPSSANPSLDMDRYRAGYIACASEIFKFLSRPLSSMPGVNITMIEHLMSSLINSLETKTSTVAFIQANSQVEAAKVENSPENTNVTEIQADPTGEFNMLLILRLGVAHSSRPDPQEM